MRQNNFELKSLRAFTLEDAKKYRRKLVLKVKAAFENEKHQDDHDDFGSGEQTD